MRLGLRLTLRPNGNKPAGRHAEDRPASGQDEDRSAPGQDEDQPATGQAGDQSPGTTPAPEPPGSEPPGGLAEDQTAELPAIALPGDVPALSHEEYLPPGARDTRAGIE